MADAAGENTGRGAPMSMRTATLTWLFLVAATALGWLFARGSPGGYARESVVVLAGIKIYLIMAVFMGLWRAPRAWHVAAIAWVAATCAAILSIVTRGGA